VTGKCYSNREVRLDGYDYVDCWFHSCRFVYSGRRAFNLTGNMISADCTLVFRDRAAGTMSALEHLHGLGDWGRKHVTASLERIAAAEGVETQDGSWRCGESGASSSPEGALRREQTSRSEER